MRARSAIQRFPVAHWKEQLATMHETAIKVNQKAAIKNGLELRGEYNTSLASSALPSSNVSAVTTPPQSSFAGHEAIEEDEEPADLPSITASPLTLEAPGDWPRDRKLSLGVRTGPGSGSPSKSSPRSLGGRATRESFRIRKGYLSSYRKESSDKRHSFITQDAVDSNASSTASSRTSSPSPKQRRNRGSLVRTSVAKAFSSFRFGEASVNKHGGARLTGDPIVDEKAPDGSESRDWANNDEVLVTPEQARASKRISMNASEQAQNSIRTSSDALPHAEESLRKASVVQQPSDAYLALIGKARQDGDEDRSSSGGAPSYVTSPHPSNPQTPVTPVFPASSTVRDFAATASPSNSNKHRTETFATRRGTITFGTPGSVTSSEHPVVENNRFSYGTVLQGKKDYALQNVEPFFTDPTGLYYKAFNLELKDLTSKNSEDALCIETFLTISEKDWYTRLHKVRMGKRASRARPATIFHNPVRRAGSVVSIFNENVESAAVPDNSAEQFLLKEQYEPPIGLKKLLLRRARQWPFYSFLLAFVSTELPEPTRPSWS